MYLCCSTQSTDPHASKEAPTRSYGTLSITAPCTLVWQVNQSDAVQVSQCFAGRLLHLVYEGRDADISASSFLSGSVFTAAV